MPRGSSQGRHTVSVWVLLAVVLAAVAAAVVVRVVRKNGAGRQAGPLHTQGRGSGNLWHSWRSDTGTGLVVSRQDGKAYIALVEPVDGAMSFSLRPASELRRAKLIMGGQVVETAPSEPDGVAVEGGRWPVLSDGDGTEMILGPIGICVILEPTAPDGYVFVTSDGPAPATGEVMQTTFGWHCRLSAMMAGNDFLDDRLDRLLLNTSLTLQRAQAGIEDIQQKLADYPG